MWNLKRKKKTIEINLFKKTDSQTLEGDMASNG